MCTGTLQEVCVDFEDEIIDDQCLEFAFVCEPEYVLSPS